MAERTKENIEADLKSTQDELKNLVEKINKQGYKEEGDDDRMRELEESEKKYQEELKKLEEGVTSNSNEAVDSNELFGKNDVGKAKEYLNTIKDKSWAELQQYGRKWISAVQVVLANNGYKVGKIDGYLGKRTKAAVWQFQVKEKIRKDGGPGPQTIKALLGITSENSNKLEEKKDDKPEEKKDDKPEEKKEEKKEETKVDDKGNTFTGTLDEDGKPLNGTYKMKDGDEFKVENGKIV